MKKHFNNMLTKRYIIGINIRKFFHPIVYKLFSLKNRNINIKCDFNGKNGVLFVGNHFCIDDIPTLALAVKKHTYFLVSDEDRYTLNGFALELNGVIWINRICKESRTIASQNVCNLLDHNNCVAMYPESTWNLSPNSLILPLNWGCIRIALKSKVPIVPVVTLFKENTSYTNIGLPFFPSANAKWSIDELRDIMATMQYNQIQQYYHDHKKNTNVYSMKVNDEIYFYEKRSEIPLNFWKNDIHSRYNKYKRSKNNPLVVRLYESQFIFEGKEDSYDYFKIFNSSIKFDKSGNMTIRRISSEKGGYSESEWLESFEYGYNEKYRYCLH